MATITLRSVKGSALTFAEMDGNFSNINTDKLEDITAESIGDLSDVDISSNTDGYVLTYNSGTGNLELQANDGVGIANVVEDTTPQLGGTLDANGNDIDMGTNTITDTKVGQWDTAYGWDDHSTQGYITDITGGAIGDLSDVNSAGVTDGQILIYNNGTGQFEAGDQTAGGISNLVEDTTPQLGGTLDANGNTIDMGTNVIADANVGNWDDAFSWGDHSVEGYLTDVVDDTTPQLGGNLDGQGNTVSDVQMENYKETVYTGGSTTGTITPDVANGNVQSITLSGNITFNAFGNAEAGQSMTLIIKQPASGGPYTLTSSMAFATDNTLSTTASAVDIMTVLYDGTDYYASLATGFA